MLLRERCFLSDVSLPPAMAASPPLYMHCTQPRDGPDPAHRGACGGLWAQLAVYDMDGPEDAGKMPSLTPGESAPRSISTRLSSLSRALSPWSGLGDVVGVRIGVAGLGSESGSADLSYV